MAKRKTTRREPIILDTGDFKFHFTDRKVDIISLMEQARKRTAAAKGITLGEERRYLRVEETHGEDD